MPYGTSRPIYVVYSNHVFNVYFWFLRRLKVFFYLDRGCTLHEVLALLDDDEKIEPRLLFFEPPEPVIDIVQDSGDEEGGIFFK